MYIESVELLRELVNNAYDADATKVYVDISPDKVEIRDNGTGMDMERLKQYFVRRIPVLVGFDDSGKSSTCVTKCESFLKPIPY